MMRDIFLKFSGEAFAITPVWTVIGKRVILTTFFTAKDTDAVKIDWHRKGETMLSRIE